MNPLTPSQRRALRAKAHHLGPVVTIGHHGLTPAVLHEIDVALLAHELIKIRVLNDDRDERNALLERICAETGAVAVQHLGKLLIVWRPAPEPEAAEPAVRARAAPGAAGGRERRPRTVAGGGAKAVPPPPSRRRRAEPAVDSRTGGRAQAAKPGVPRGVAAPVGREPRRGGADAKGTPGRRPATTRGTAAKPAAPPHGKSRSSTTGAAGARRRRKVR
jgi:putative YhbY family RNA-binding protein